MNDQGRRALNSIILNIAEGANKRTDKDTRLYITRALGSLNEVIACLDCALDSNYINQDEHRHSLEKAQELAKQLNAFSGYLYRSANNKPLPVKD